MPFELGLDFGCRRYGGDPYSEKVILILEEQRYRYQEAISDLAGSDIEAHQGDYNQAVRKVRNWIATQGEIDCAGAARILAQYEDFQTWHYKRQRAAGFSDDDIRDYPTPELLDAMNAWIEQGSPRE